MTARVHGTVTQWHGARGFGFVTLPRTDATIFVHISAFPSGSGPPRIGEVISFEVETTADGRSRGVNALRAHSLAKNARAAASEARESRSWRPVLGGVIAFTVMVGLVYRETTLRLANAERPAPTTIVPASRPVPLAAPASRCDGRTSCGQMHSCSEARYFLRNCPGTTMDGDHDGIPCEQQWCN